MSDGTDSRKEIASVRVIVSQAELGPCNRLLASQCAMFCFTSNDVTGMRPRSRGGIYDNRRRFFSWPQPREAKVIAGKYTFARNWRTVK